MPKVKIVRSNEFINRFRNYVIYIGNKRLGTVSNGRSIELEVPEGEHSIYAKVDWCSSPTETFRVAGNESKTFHVGGFKGAKWLLPLGLIAITLYSVLAYSLKIDRFALVIVLLPTFFILMYFITLGRKKYLTLESENKGV